MAFRLEEATIGELHRAIRTGATTWVAVVRHYLARVRAYNGVARDRRYKGFWNSSGGFTVR